MIQKEKAYIYDQEVVGLRRKMDKAGRICIPIEYRQFLGIDCNEEIEMILIENGFIVRPIAKEK